MWRPVSVFPGCRFVFPRGPLLRLAGCLFVSGWPRIEAPGLISAPVEASSLDHLYLG